MSLDELENKYNDLQEQIHKLELEQTELLKDYVENTLGIKRNAVLKIDNISWFKDRTLVYAGDLILRVILKDMSRVNRYAYAEITLEGLKKWHIEIVGHLDKDLSEYMDKG